MFSKTTIILLGIIIFALFLRVYNLSNLPFGFFCDEASIGYNAFSILTTGKDEHGIQLPLFFEAFGEYKTGLYIYSVVPFVPVLGLNEFSTRLPSVLFSVLTVLLLFKIAETLWSKKLGILAAIIASIMPWLIHYGRVGMEYSIYCFFFTLTIYFFILMIKHQKVNVFFFISAALTLYSHQPAKLIIPVCMLLLFLFYFKLFKHHIKQTVYGILIFLVLCIPIVLSIFDGTFFARFEQVSIFSSLHDPIQITTTSLANYVIQLDPNYLFFSGEPTYITRHFTNNFAPLLITTLPFLLFGLFVIVKNIKRNKYYPLLFIWLILYPIGGAVTYSAPFTGRAVIGAPLFALLIALGISKFLELFKDRSLRRVVAFLVTLIITVNFILFLHFYFIVYPRYSSDFWGWQYGPRDIMTYFLENKNNYDQLIIMGSLNAPEIFLKFYDPTNKCQGKCMLGDINSYNPSAKQLFAVGADKVTELGGRLLVNKKTLRYPDGKPAFYIGELEGKN